MRVFGYPWYPWALVEMVEDGKVLCYLEILLRSGPSRIAPPIK